MFAARVRMIRNQCSRAGKFFTRRNSIPCARRGLSSVRVLPIALRTALHVQGVAHMIARANDI
jgi:hypothetical protein